MIGNSDRTFKANYKAELTSNPQKARKVLCFPGAIEDAWVDGIGVEFFPNDNEAWYGTFASDELSPNAVSLLQVLPDTQNALVVSAGAGYVVNVHNPKKWSEIPVRPIMGVLTDHANCAVYIWDFVRFICLGAEGLRWKTDRISWDGIEDVHVNGNILDALVWNAPKKMYDRIEINTKTGSLL